MLTDSPQIIIALNTGTSPQPKKVKDYTWYEERVINIAIEVCHSFSDEQKIISNARGLDIFVEIAGIYAKDFDIKSVELLFQKFKSISKLIYPIKVDDTQQHTYKEQLAFVDAQGRFAISALLGLSNYLNEKLCEEIAERVAKVNWRDKKSIYLAGLPAAMLPRLEMLFNQLKNERIIEGKQISADWYIKALCIQQYLLSLRQYFDFLKSIHQDYFQSNFDKLSLQQQFPLAVHLIQRWKEFAAKYRTLISYLEKHVENCNSFRKLKDLPWSDFDFDEEEQIALEREKEVTDKMIQLLPKLKTLAPRNDLPDYFGQALTIGVQACYDACADKNHERLEKIFPAVFDASFVALNRLREKVKDWSQVGSQIAFMREPLENLFEISGYAKLYSELYQSPALWNIVENKWGTYFESIDDPKQTIQFIVDMTSYHDNLSAMMPQATLRFNWQAGFENKLRERGIPIFPYDRNYRRRQPTHQSPVIRVLERSGGLRLMAATRDIFFVTYLSTLPAAGGIKFPDRYHFKELIQEEQQNLGQGIDEDE